MLDKVNPDSWSQMILVNSPDSLFMALMDRCVKEEVKEEREQRLLLSTAGSTASAPAMVLL